jgi:hypothetical protein
LHSSFSFLSMKIPSLPIFFFIEQLCTTIHAERKGKGQNHKHSHNRFALAPFSPLSYYLLGYADKQVTRQIWQQTFLPDK